MTSPQNRPKPRGLKIRLLLEAACTSARHFIWLLTTPVQLQTYLEAFVALCLAYPGLNKTSRAPFDWRRSRGAECLRQGEHSPIHGLPILPEQEKKLKSCTTRTPSLPPAFLRDAALRFGSGSPRTGSWARKGSVCDMLSLLLLRLSATGTIWGLFGPASGCSASRGTGS